MSNETVVASLPIKEQVDLLAQALLREHMHRRNFRQTLKKFDEECPRDERTISSRAVMKELLNIPVNGRASRLHPRKGEENNNNNSNNDNSNNNNNNSINSSRSKPVAPTFMEELCSYRLTKREYAMHTAQHRNEEKDNNMPADEKYDGNEFTDDPSDVEMSSLEQAASKRVTEIADIYALIEQAAEIRRQQTVEKKLKSSQEKLEQKEQQKKGEEDNGSETRNELEHLYNDKFIDNENNSTKESNHLFLCDESDIHNKQREEKKEKEKKNSKGKKKKKSKKADKEQIYEQKNENYFEENSERQDKYESNNNNNNNNNNNLHSKRWLIATEDGKQVYNNELNHINSSNNNNNNNTIMHSDNQGEESDAYSDQLEQTVTQSTLSAPVSLLGAHWTPPTTTTLSVQKESKRNSLNSSSNTSLELNVESLQTTPRNSSGKGKLQITLDKSDVNDLLKYDPLFAPHKSVRDLALEDSSSSNSSSSNSNNSSSHDNSDESDNEFLGKSHKSHDMNEYVKDQIRQRKRRESETNTSSNKNESTPSAERRVSGSITSGLSLSFDRPQLNKSELRQAWQPSKTKSSAMTSSGYLDSPFSHTSAHHNNNNNNTNNPNNHFTFSTTPSQTRSSPSTSMHYSTTQSHHRNKVGLNAAGYSTHANISGFTSSATRLFAAEPTSNTISSPLPAPQTGSILVHHDSNGSRLATFTSSEREEKRNNYSSSNNHNSNDTTTTTNNSNDDNYEHSQYSNKLTHAVSDRPAHFENHSAGNSYSDRSNNFTQSATTTAAAATTTTSPEIHNNEYSPSPSIAPPVQLSRRVGIGFNFNKKQENSVGPSSNRQSFSQDNSVSGTSKSRKSRSVTIITEEEIN